MTILEAERIRMRFGQHSGLSLAEIAVDDVLYLDWLAGVDNLDVYLKDAVRVMCEKHERAIDRAIAAGGRRHREPSREKQGKLF